jgi:hypothetical protein
MGDPAVDITDFYAFPSPDRPGNLVLIMNVFPLATPGACFSDVLTYRFRLRPLTRSGGGVTPGTVEHTIDATFNDVPDGASIQKGHIVTSDGREVSFVTGAPAEKNGVRVFAGLVSDPFFMDVEATLRTDFSGDVSFAKPGNNTVQYRDVLAIVVEVPITPIVQRFEGATLVGAIAEDIVTRRGKPIRIERFGRAEIKNVMLLNSTRDPRAKGIELRDLYNREDAFAVSKEYASLYATRLDANLTFWDGLDGLTAWPLGPDGQHPLRDLLMGDFQILDLARAFAPGNYLEIERSIVASRPHESAGGRWLDDDILDEMLTFFVNGGRGERFGDGVDGPTKPGSLSFPYVREPNNRSDLPLPAFLRS